MENLLQQMSGYGFQGVLIAILLYNAFYTQRKLFQIIENNTKAFDELKATLEKCQVIHRDA